MKKTLLLFCCFLTGLFTLAQAQVELPETIDFGNDAYVFKDARIDLLVQQQRYYNMLALRNISGYRVQVLSTKDRSAATGTRSKLMQLFPDYKTYLDYQSPYFRVRIGDFVHKDSASALQKELSPYFPNGVFSVRSKIKIDPKTLLEQLKTSND